MAEIVIAKDVKDQKKILDWIDEKQTNEQKMLEKLNIMFRGGIQTRIMRSVLLAAFEMMCHEITNPSTERPALDAVKKEGGLAVWSTLFNPTFDPRERIMRMTTKLINGDNAIPPLDCNDLSELIRVVGTWLENGGGFGVPNINLAYRVGAGRVKRPEDTIYEYFIYLMDLKKKYGDQYSNRMTPNERKKLIKLETPPNYIELQGVRDDQNWSKKISRQREDGTIHHDIESHVAKFWIRPKLNNDSGMQKFRANCDDLCKKIDLLFGFILGATISGTTTDTVMVLELFGNLIKPPLHPGYYLFPVATIAASLHHSLLEAGLGLTVADVIESYCAGFYTTLIPKGGLPGELEGAEAILKKAEELPENRHLLIWYNGNEKLPAGCIRWNKPYEVREARRLVEGKGLLTHIGSMPRVPDKMAIMRLIKLMAPRLFAYLPEEFQLR